MARNHSGKVVHVACDHAGFPHKETIVKWLLEEGYTVNDHGAKVYEEEDDFTDFVSLAAKAVSQNPEESCGIIFGGSGQGEAMLANRFSNVRATVFYGGAMDIINLSREHNNANILSIGARFVDINVCKEAIWLWLTLETELNERHKRRIMKIEKITRDIRTL